MIDGLHAALADAKALLARHEELNQQSLENLMRSFHLIKGYAQALGLLGVQSTAHELESRVFTSLQASRHAITSAELRAIFAEGVLKIDSVFSKMHEMELRAIAQGGIQKAPTQRRLSDLFCSMQSMARSLAIEMGKPCRFEVQGGQGQESIPLPSSWKMPLEAALLHAIRNSLDHGGEPLDLHLSAQRQGNQVVIRFSDQGAGIDPERVRRAAIQKGAGGDESRIRQMSAQELLQLLFQPGFSLSKGISKLSGRGYGLNIVQEAIEVRLGGKVSLESQPGKGTTLTFVLPLVSRS